MQAARQAMPPIEHLKSFRELAEVVGVNKATLWRWYDSGIKTDSGRIKLAAWNFGEFRTTLELVRSFIELRTAGKAGRTTESPATTTANKKRSAAIQKQLAKQGVRSKSK